MPKRGFNIEDSFAHAVALGLVPGVKPFDVFGIRVNMDQDIEQDIGPTGDNEIALPAIEGQQLYIVSDNAADVGQVIEVEALGPNAVELDLFEVTLNGTTPVPFPEALVSRINEAEVVSDSGFAGLVSIQNQAATETYGVLRTEDQQMNQALFTVPAGKRWTVDKLISTMQRSQGTENEVTISVRFKKVTQDTTAWRRPFSFGLQRSGDSGLSLENRFPVSTKGPVDLKLTARSTVVGGNVSGWINGLIFDDSPAAG